jgi:phosphoadenosine phosphosulfate reductase
MSLAQIQEKADAAQSLISETLARGGDACVTSSFQTECVALVHLLIAQKPDIPVLFLDTGYHFAETYAYRDEMAARLNLNLVNLKAARSVPEQEAQFGLLYQTDPSRCCGFRKVEPLFGAVERYDVWFTGLRRDQSPTRANLKHVDDFQLPSGKKILKVSPLADWTTKDVWDYLKLHDLPVLPLYDRGYTSIGCEPCTSLPFDPDNPRSGRWSGQKLECGIHIAPK